MSQENLQALRRAYDAWARGDLSRRELFDPNIEGVWAAELPDPHVDKGIEAFFASSREWLATWEEFRLEAEAFLPVEDKAPLGRRASVTRAPVGVPHPSLRAEPVSCGHAEAIGLSGYGGSCRGRLPEFETSAGVVAGFVGQGDGQPRSMSSLGCQPFSISRTVEIEQPASSAKACCERPAAFR